jgi:hypothetical protein
MCVNPRKLNVSGFAFSLMARFSTAEAAELHQTGFLPVNRGPNSLSLRWLYGSAGHRMFVEPDDDVIGVSDITTLPGHSDVATDAPTDQKT